MKRENEAGMVEEVLTHGSKHLFGEEVIVTECRDVEERCGG